MPQIYIINARILQRLQAPPSRGAARAPNQGAYAAPGPRPVLEPPSSHLPGPALTYEQVDEKHLSPLERQLVSWLVGVLSPVNYKVSYQGSKRTSIHVLVTLCVSHLSLTTIVLQQKTWLILKKQRHYLKYNGKYRSTSEIKLWRWDHYNLYPDRILSTQFRFKHFVCPTQLTRFLLYGWFASLPHWVWFHKKAGCNPANG